MPLMEIDVLMLWGGMMGIQEEVRESACQTEGKTNNEGACHGIKDSAMKENHTEYVETRTDFQGYGRLLTFHVHHVNVGKNSEIPKLMEIYFLQKNIS